jgi:hypothetical protein
MGEVYRARDTRLGFRARRLASMLGQESSPTNAGDRRRADRARRDRGERGVSERPGFGLAKPLAPAGASASLLSDSPTLSIETQGRSYDVSPDGQRLLVSKHARTIEQRRVRLVQNWFEELERLVPGGG